MTTKTKPIPDAVNWHLSAYFFNDTVGVSHYINRGIALITPESLEALRDRQVHLEEKISALPEFGHLRHHLELLTTYFGESWQGGQESIPAQRAAAFALLYFLNDFDRVPDTVPVHGLLDDAAVVQAVLQQYKPVLQAHWKSRRREWPGA